MAATLLSVDECTRDIDFISAYGPLVAAQIDRACEIVVVIPARDERETLPDTLAALAQQRDLHGRQLPRCRFEVIVLANNCADDTATVARQFAVTNPDVALHVAELDLPEEHAHVGVARRLLMDEAARRLHLTRRGAAGVIVSTDADTVADPTWLAATLAEVSRGADAVGGRIIVDPADVSNWHERTRAWHLRDVGYRMLASELDWHLDPVKSDPWPRHFQHFGPSIAVTVDAYERAGRLPVVSALEDVGLYRALQRIDARVRHSPGVRVCTSGREIGRVGFGFSVQLQLWAEQERQSVPFMVESPQAIAAAAVARRRLRQAWVERESRLAHQPECLAADLCVTPQLLSELLESSATFGVLLQQIEVEREQTGCWAERWPPMEIGSAIATLREWLAALRQPDAVRSNRSSRYSSSRCPEMCCSSGAP